MRHRNWNPLILLRSFKQTPNYKRRKGRIRVIGRSKTNMQGFRISFSNKNYRQAGFKKVVFMEAMSISQTSMPSRKI
jgi:hypothetical protein